jgi:hypothetical protein
VDGKALPDLNNQKFVDQRLRIKDAISTVKSTFSSTSVMKYLKTASNGTDKNYPIFSSFFSFFKGIPQKKLTAKSIIEATFISSDKNKDYELDLIEFSDFVLIGLPKIGSGLQDYTEALKVAKLFDFDHNDKICMTGKQFKKKENLNYTYFFQSSLKC